GTNHPRSVCNFTNAIDPVTLGHHCDQTIVWKDEELSLVGFHHYRFASASHSRLDHGNENGTGREVWTRSFEITRPIQNGIGRYLVRNIDDVQRWIDVQHDS